MHQIGEVYNAEVTVQYQTMVMLPIEPVLYTVSPPKPPMITLYTSSRNTLKATVPVSYVTASTVAKLVKSDGTVEIIKTAVPVSEGLVVPMSDGQTIQIVENKKDFADVSQSFWAHDAVAFVTSREIFNGVSADSFSPNSNLTRAQLTTILARFDGVDTSTGATVHERGREWAIQKGISDGSNPDGRISREQLVTMLWRYAGSPMPGGGLSEFSDAGAVSGYARQALAWATENGIISGNSGRISPQANATRAQVAAIMQRYIASIA